MSETATVRETDDSPNAPGGGQESNRAKLRAIVIGPVLKQDLTTGQSKELPPDDLLERLAADGKIVEPPFDKLVLAMLAEHSTELGPAVEVMAQNIDGFGHRVEMPPSIAAMLERTGATDQVKAEVAVERARLTNFFGNCCVDYSFVELRKRTRRDLEETGDAFWEVVRIPKTGEIVWLNHLVSYQMRLGIQDKEFTRASRKVALVTPDGQVQLETVAIQKRFRRFVQARMAVVGRMAAVSTRPYQLRWFKEFGDPRVVDNRTGDVVPPDKADAFPEEHRASEVVHWKIYSPRTPYGLPRYIGNLITIFGDRAADEVNFVTLKNNNIPSMVVMVSNGQLTGGSVQRIQDFIESQVSGSANYSRFLLLEAEGQYEGPDTGHMKIEIKQLTQEQMRDQLFQEYSKNNREKIRGAFRIPDIFFGRNSDVARATAEAIRRLADEQVFSPERNEFDCQVNKLLLPEMGARYHVFRSNSPNVTDDEDLIKVLQAGERTGAITPRIARMVLSDILNIENLPPLDPSVPLDVPFSITLAETVKNQGPIESQAGWVDGADRRGLVAKALGLTRDDILREILSARGEIEERVSELISKRVKE